MKTVANRIEKRAPGPGQQPRHHKEVALKRKLVFVASVEEIEARLSAVEHALESLRSSGELATGAAASSEDALWALDGLRQRAHDGGAVVYAGTVELPACGMSQWQYTLPSKTIFGHDWAEHAATLAALGSPVRLQILREVLNGASTAAALVESLDTGTSGQIYHHLKELTANGWLVSERRAVYQVPTARIVPLLAILVAAGTPA